MKLEQDVIIDLLPAYFSGEASAATRAVVEDYFQENPEFEKMARAGSWPLEGLKVPFRPPDKEKEKLALELARRVTEERNSMLWLAICFSLILLLFRVHDHKLVWVMWQDPGLGSVFSLLVIFFWISYWRSRVRPEPVRAHARFLRLAVFYSVLLALFWVTNRVLGWFPSSGYQ
ncbi:MAG TPA: hypothetical protein VFY05_11430, partial [Candidatus Angelobacter sp.]|nr:hypothetical protein [Candidatus Angelobacter sp.]